MDILKLEWLFNESSQLSKRVQHDGCQAPSIKLFVAPSFAAIETKVTNPHPPSSQPRAAHWGCGDPRSDDMISILDNPPPPSVN